MGGHNKAVDIIFHVFSILVAVAVLACAIYRFTLPLNANAVVLACYLILFGIVIFIMELKPPTIMVRGATTRSTSTCTLRTRVADAATLCCL